MIADVLTKTEKTELKGKSLVPGTGFEPVTSGHKALAPYKLQIMSLAP